MLVAFHCIYVHICVHIYIYACVCGCEWLYALQHTATHCNTL